MNARLTLAAVALMAAASSHAAAATSARQCFSSRDINNYAQQDRRTINVRARVGDVYRIELMQDCPDLNSVRGVLFQSHGSAICSGMDVTILVPDGIMQRRCEGRSVRKLTPEEVKELPSGARP